MITLTKTTDSIILDKTENLSALEISYSGSLVGEILGNTISGMNKKKIVILFLSQPDDVIMTYYGRFNITKVVAYDKESKPIKISRNTYSDNINSINSKWDLSTTTYENYNKTNKYIGNVKTILSSTLNGEKRYLNKKGEMPENKLKSNQASMLNRNRGNYGVKQK